MKTLAGIPYCSLTLLSLLAVSTLAYSEEPNKSYELKDGRFVVGQVVTESDTAYLVKNLEGENIRIPFEDIVHVTVVTSDEAISPIQAANPPESLSDKPDLSPIVIINPICGRTIRSGKIKFQDGGNYIPSHGVPIDLCKRFHMIFEGDVGNNTCEFTGHMANLAQQWLVASIDSQTRFRCISIEHQENGKFTAWCSGWSDHAIWYSEQDGVAYKLTGDGTSIHFEPTTLEEVPSRP